MDSRVRGLVAAATCAAAVLTGVTTAQAVDQFPKNGCTSPQPYSGTMTTAPFNPQRDSGTLGADVTFNGWFEIESVSPGSFDTITVEFLDPEDPEFPDTWRPLTDVDGNDLLAQSTANSGGGPDQPYSNNGTNVPPNFQSYTFTLPESTNGSTGVQVRITFDTGDETYQGFRGLGIDDFAVSDTFPAFSDNFSDGEPANWTGFNAPSGQGGPFWQVLTDPSSVSIKSPEINPDLVTLSA